MMSFGDERRARLSRAEAADKLIDIATQLKAGAVTSDGETVQVPEIVVLEVEVDDGEIEIQMRWASAFDLDDAAVDDDEEEIVYGENVDDDDDDDAIDADDDIEDEDPFSATMTG
jgi:amphi-Trp domain-containing protein